MKIIVFDNPKVLGPILRVMFGIKKESKIFEKRSFKVC